MKIIRNLPGFFKLWTTLKKLNEYKSEIEDAKAKGDVERECRNILLAETVWSSDVLTMFGSELVVPVSYTHLKLDISTRMELVHLVNQENGPGGPL